MTTRLMCLDTAAAGLILSLLPWTPADFLSPLCLCLCLWDSCCVPSLVSLLVRTLAWHPESDVALGVEVLAAAGQPFAGAPSLGL